jgi:hypothetical protein
MTLPSQGPTTQSSPSRKKAFRRIGADRYRAIELRIWDLIRGLDSDASRLFHYLWYGPHSTPYGIQRLPDGYIRVDLGWPEDQLARAWEALKAADVVWRDGELVFVVPFLMSNPPANEDVVKHWSKMVATLPPSPLFKELYLRASAWVFEDGLSWLAPKIDTVSDTVSTPSQDRADTGGHTGSTLSTQDSVLRDQYQGSEPERREQGAGGVQRGEREEPDGSSRSASPSETASLDSPGSGNGSNGGTKAASNGKTLDPRKQLRVMVRDGSPNSLVFAYMKRNGLGDKDLRDARDPLPDL